ncbi:hypothetical protein M2366_002350 [Aeromonas sp. BIGb0405]|uniref:DUF3289 family protein n=1 Tax=Aeromonas sp. BIGb0405 TaxID=2940592 RepID=UPI002169D1A1|nr:DUF3289 family protein [Aeromonas sp. BIGb0405]MCS3456264.1 hypothetical protein [Aeromonas sp. BIGb0405]
MTVKRLDDLKPDEFLFIRSASADGRSVLLADSPASSCCSLAHGQLEVQGDRSFSQNVRTAYERAKLSDKVAQAGGGSFGSAPAQAEPPSALAQQMKADTTSATAVRLPILVYQSPKLPGKNADGTMAADMTFGDMTAEQIQAIPTVWDTRLFALQDLDKSRANYHFMNLRTMATTLFSAGTLQMVILAMIHKFEKSEGGEFRHPDLERAVRAHPNTRKFSDVLIEGVKRSIEEHAGEPNNISFNEWKKSYGEELFPPAFHTFSDKYLGWVNGGLTMAINDVWSGRAELVAYERSGRSYKGRLKVTFTDNFGLDLPDVGPDPDTGIIKPYSGLVGFRSWFVLQHLNRFAYKPFLTVVELYYPIQGELP